MKQFLLCALFLVFLTVSAQKPHPEYGKLSEFELNLTKYNNDPEAAGVVLFEKAHYRVDVKDNYIYLVLHFHRRIKVFNAAEFEGADIEISYYGGADGGEFINTLRAVTHNGERKLYVSEKDIYKTEDDTGWATTRFSFPDVKDGSILEYEYELMSPYFYNLNEWNFANEYPTIYSELKTEIPANFIYNKTLFGDRKLDWEEASVKKSCFHLPGYRVPGDCEVGVYAMEYIPAAKSENYMLSPYNYVPSIRFELVQMTDMSGTKRYIANSWKNLDGYYNSNSNLGRELRNASFMKRQLPDSILNIADKTTRAKAIFYFVQDYMSWNNYYRLRSKTDVKKAFAKKQGHSAEINLMLINALEAGGLDAKAMLIATRDKPVPSKVYPVLAGFNYVLARLDIDGQIYHLDATNKNTPFGVLPSHALNADGRVLDFKKGSFWESIVPFNRNIHFANVKFTADAQGNFTGLAEEVYSGYLSSYIRSENEGVAMERLLRQKQNENEHLEVSDLEIENRSQLDEPYKMRYALDLEEQSLNQGGVYYLSPLLIKPFFTHNPFSQEERLYPIDLGYPIMNNYLVSFDLSDQYEVVKLPENQSLRLPNNDGELSVAYQVNGNVVTMRLNVRLNSYHFPKDAYPSLRAFFAELIQAQSGVLELKKVN